MTTDSRTVAAPGATLGYDVHGDLGSGTPLFMFGSPMAAADFAALAALAVFLRRRDRHFVPLLVLFVSGMSYWILSLPIVPGAEYRYQSWTMAASALIVLYALGVLLRSFAARAAEAARKSRPAR